MIAVMDHSAVEAVLAALERERVRYAVFGGAALNLHGLARFTEERVPLGDLLVSVVTPRTLYEMKKDTVRAKDRADAEALRLRFGFGEEP